MMRRGVLAVLAVLALVAAGCGDGDGDASGSGSGSDGGSASSGEGLVTAVLGIITTNIDTDTGEGFVDASEGEELVVGDRVRTDATGFAELTYHDGSWMRVESEATLTLEDLADNDGGQVVSTSIDTGEAWSRVVDLAEPEDEFVVDTPVASAAVRGTAFAIDCDGDTACTFSVVEGEVLVTPDVGETVTLTAGQRLTVTSGEEPRAPEEPGVAALSVEPFIAKNLELDETTATDGTGDDSDDGETGAEETGAGTIAGTYVGLQTILTIDAAPDAINVGPDVGGQQPISFEVTGPCQDGSTCDLTFTQPGAPTETMPLDVSGTSASGSVAVARTNGLCSWTEDWTLDVVVEGDELTGTATVAPESLAIECGGGIARPIGGTSRVEASRR